ncbi:MAG TPA: hypothetical protein VE999_01980 [Gemmataceae bacterium]|nr:hypothetical protein [Gemmataceae bacterium]
MIRLYAKPFLHLAALGLTALAASGCDPSAVTVSGKVTAGGRPVTAGTVLFLGADNQIATGNLDGEGHYVVPHAPTGNVKVAVLTLRPQQIKAARYRPKEAPPLPSRLTNLVPVAEKYQSPETSGLTCDVQKSRQEYDIALP